MDFQNTLREPLSCDWERMIRTVGKFLLAIMPEVTLNDDELLTLLIKNSICTVTSRSLTVVVLEADRSPHPITPNHLIRFNPGTAAPPCETDEANQYSKQRFSTVQFAANEFWRKWMAEYVKTI